MSIANIFEGGERTQDKGHIKNLVLLAKSDNHLSDDELLLIHKIGRSLGLSYAIIGSLIDNPEQISVIPPSSKEERLEHMVDMIDLIQIDGVIDAGEMRMISKFAVQIGYDDLSDVPMSDILNALNAGEDKSDIVTKLL